MSLKNTQKTTEITTLSHSVLKENLTINCYQYSSPTSSLMFSHGIIYIVINSKTISNHPLPVANENFVLLSIKSIWKKVQKKLLVNLFNIYSNPLGTFLLSNLAVTTLFFLVEHSLWQWFPNIQGTYSALLCLWAFAHVAASTWRSSSLLSKYQIASYSLKASSSITFLVMLSIQHFLMIFHGNWRKLKIFSVHQYNHQWLDKNTELQWYLTNFKWALSAFWQFYCISLVHSFSIPSRWLFYTFSSPILIPDDDVLPTSERK